MDAYEIYGYCRVSTAKQKIERQVRNIKAEYPDAVIVTEHYTGTKIEGREEWNKLYARVMKRADAGRKIIIVFDSVSRMSRNAEEGFRMYEEMFRAGIELRFLKEPHINTEIYRSALENKIPLTGTDVDIILSAVSEYLMILAKKQIQIAFEQSEKEVKDLQRRTSEGIRVAAMNGQQIGRVKGKKYVTKKETEAKQLILKHSKDFGGSCSDSEVMKLAGVSRNTYYRYKRELRKEESIS